MLHRTAALAFAVFITSSLSRATLTSRQAPSINATSSGDCPTRLAHFGDLTRLKGADIAHG
jgi:hypothetical protein